MSELEIYKFEQLENLVYQLEKDVNSLIFCVCVLFGLIVTFSILFFVSAWCDKR